LSCEEAVATPTAASAGGLAPNSGSTIAAIVAIVVAVDAHVPIEISRLRESVGKG